MFADAETGGLTRAFVGEGTLLSAAGLAVAANATSLTADARIFVVSIGLFMIISRRSALMQVIGYLMLENGIFVFGVITVVETPLLVELGVLLDAFVAVFVMGIAIFHINREFGSMDVDQLRALRG